MGVITYFSSKYAKLSDLELNDFASFYRIDFISWLLLARSASLPMGHHSASLPVVPRFGSFHRTVHRRPSWNTWVFSLALPFQPWFSSSLVFLKVRPADCLWHHCFPSRYLMGPQYIRRHTLNFEYGYLGSPRSRCPHTLRYNPWLTANIWDTTSTFERSSQRKAKLATQRQRRPASRHSSIYPCDFSGRM